MDDRLDNRSDDRLDSRAIACLILAEEQRIRARIRRRDLIIFYIMVVSFIIVILLGTIGYVYIFQLSWLDALLNATLVLTAISTFNNPITDGQKWFVIIYALISVILLLAIVNSAIHRAGDLFIDGI
jgi:hypothetical protein